MKLLSGLLSIQALLKALGEYGDDGDLELKYYFAHKEDNYNCVKYLFFAYPESLKFF